MGHFLRCSVFAGLTVAALLAPAAAQACRCSPFTPQQSVAWSDVIFKGTVVSIVEPFSPYSRINLFRIERTWKGWPLRWRLVWTEYCDGHFEAGQRELREGHLEMAKAEFNRSLEVLLESAYGGRTVPRIREHFDRLVERISAYELTALAQGDGFTEKKYEPATIDDLLAISTFEQPPATPETQKTVSADLEETPHDIEIPRAYGIDQTVGDTFGPGGVFRGLRTVPALHEVAVAMLEVCPDAWLLNYANPMAVNCWATELTGVRLVGLCHSVQGTSELLARELDVPYDEVTFDCAGVNHTAWFTTFRRGDEDLLPRIREVMRARHVDGRTHGRCP